MIENDPAYTATMVLPDLAGGELTDEEFEAVSGGFGFGHFQKAKILYRDMAMASSPLVSVKAKADSFLNIPIDEKK